MFPMSVLPLLLVSGTVLGWAYYGERCVEYFPVKGLIPYRVLFIIPSCAFISSDTAIYSLLFSTMPSFSSQVRFRLILAGLPITREPSGITVFLVTRLPAPMIQSFPIFAPSRITAPIPISVRSPMVHPWITALCPTVTLFPIWTGMLWLT